MMKLYALVKANMINYFSIISKINKKHHFSNALLSVFIIIFYIVVIYCLYSVLKIFLPVFQESASSELLFAVVIATSSIYTFVKSYINSNNYIFRTNDYNQLICLPVEPKIIVTSKVIGLYISITLNTIIQLVPMYMIHLKIDGFSFWFLIQFIIYTLLLPIVPMSLGSLCAFFIGLAPVKTVYKKIANAFVFLAVGAFLTVQFAIIISKSFTKEIAVEYIVNWFYRFNLFGKIGFIGFFENKIFLYLIYILLSIIVLLFLIYIVAAFYKNFNNIRIVTFNKKKKVKEKELKFKQTSGSFLIILKKDLFMAFKLPSYIVNVIIGPILALLLICLINFSVELKDLIYQFFTAIEIEYRFQDNVIFFGCIIIILLNYSMTTTSAAFSIEGRYNDVMRSMPIRPGYIFLSKILVNIITAIPLLVITGIILYLNLNSDLNVVIFGYATVLLYIINISIIGLYFDIKYPRLQNDGTSKGANKGYAVTLTTMFSFVVIAFESFVGYCMFSIFTNVDVIRYEFITNIAFFILALWLLIGRGYPRYKKLVFK